MFVIIEAANKKCVWNYLRVEKIFIEINRNEINLELSAFDQI